MLLCDESHRIGVTSNNRFTEADKRSSKLQIDELFSAGKVLVFFVDDRQAVRPGNRFGRDRQAGRRGPGPSSATSWRLSSAARVSRVCQLDRDHAQHRADRQRPLEQEQGLRFSDNGVPSGPGCCHQGSCCRRQHGRLMAGLSVGSGRIPNPDGTLFDDVVLGSFVRPWNAKSGAGHLREHPRRVSGHTTRAGWTRWAVSTPPRV